MVYEKILKISTLNPSEHNEGSIVNHINVDAVKFKDAVGILVYGVDCFWQLVFGLAFGFYLYGWLLLVLLGTFMFFTVAGTFIFKFYLQNQQKLMDAKDKTSKFLKTTIKNLKYVKMMTWENYCYEKISSFRGKELYMLKKNIF